jgi:hypothetical protein
MSNRICDGNTIIVTADRLTHREPKLLSRALELAIGLDATFSGIELPGRNFYFVVVKSAQANRLYFDFSRRTVIVSPRISNANQFGLRR